MKKRAVLKVAPTSVIKLGVALKELRETVHWLKLIDRAHLISNRDLTPLIREGGELVAILTAAARTARSGLAAAAVGRTPRTA